MSENLQGPACTQAEAEAAGHPEIHGAVAETVETERETVYLVTPIKDDPNHNCDAMGCGTSRVLARVRKQKGGE